MKITAKCTACKEQVEPLIEKREQGLVVVCPRCNLVIKKIPYEENTQTKSENSKKDGENKRR